MNRIIPPNERAIALVYIILPSKSPEPFKTFIKCLQEEKEHTGHHELAKKLIDYIKRKMVCNLRLYIVRVETKTLVFNNSYSIKRYLLVLAMSLWESHKVTLMQGRRHKI